MGKKKAGGKKKGGKGKKADEPASENARGCLVLSGLTRTLWTLGQAPLPPEPSELPLLYRKASFEVIESVRGVCCREFLAEKTGRARCDRALVGSLCLLSSLQQETTHWHTPDTVRHRGAQSQW